MGILFLVRRTLKRVTIFGENASEILPERLLNTCSGLILMMYFTVNPVVNLCLLDDNMDGFPNWCYQLGLKFKPKHSGTKETSVEHHELHQNTVETGRATGNEVKVDVHTSRVSTYCVSSREEECVGGQLVRKNDIELVENEELCCANTCAESVVKVIGYKPASRETLI